MWRIFLVLVAAATITCSFLPVRAHAPAPPDKPLELPVGKWSIEFANGVKEACKVNRDGEASVAEPLRTSAGKTEVKDDSIVLVFQDDRVERWTPVGSKMVVEHWAARAQFPNGRPVLGIGQKE
jgi:hypothetical protein